MRKLLSFDSRVVMVVVVNRKVARFGKCYAYKAATTTKRLYTHFGI
jgi:hypothetical protein